MYVPNYVPEQLEVPGNVAEQRYMLRMAFVKAVSIRHLGSVVLTALATRLDYPSVNLVQSATAFAFVLLSLEFARILFRGRKVEGQIAMAALPLVLVTAGCFVQQLTKVGLPVWALAIGPLASTTYAIFAGRDYSFVGNFLLSLIASTVAIAAVCGQAGYSRLQAGEAFCLNLAFLTYVIYDLASLQSRRRLGEEWAAVTDLYRDVFNLVGYIRRIIIHWQKHKIWNLPRTP